MENTDTHVLSVAIPRPLDGLFTYLVPNEMLSKITVGGWVTVPFGKSKTHAFIVEPPEPLGKALLSVAPEQLREIIEVGDELNVVPEDVMALCRFAHEYYKAPLGEALNCAVSAASLGLRNLRVSTNTIRPRKKKEATKIFYEPVRHILTEAQRDALATLENIRQKKDGPRAALLHGVTGSGKTELYLELARRTIAEGKSALFLVPEIALTPQLHQRLEAGLGMPVALWHSALSDSKRRDLGKLLRTGELQVALGARSAVFAPLNKLGLIVVDEEHDPTYKQQDRLRYNGRDLALVRGKLTGAFVVLGSATPSLESKERVNEKRYGIASLAQRIAIGGLPTVEIINLCQETKIPDIQAPLAAKTLNALCETIAAGDQAIVFLNRRGFASFLLCQSCGEVPQCNRCSVSLTVHRFDRHLRCHVCGNQQPIPELCPKCRNPNLKPIGAGTESLEEELPPLIPGARPLRLDRDKVTSAGRLDRIINDFRTRKANLLLGTQMLVKGHDFPGVTLVVVVLADSLFRLPDFRSPERAYQVLTQVSGRAGRGDKPGRVLIQTFQPEHPVIQAVRGDISESAFLESERELRKALSYPPFGRLARLRLESEEQREAQNRAQQLAQALFRGGQYGSQYGSNDGAIDILGPSEAFIERAKGIYRLDLLIKAQSVGPLQRAVSSAQAFCSQKHWQLLVDIDPYGIG